MVKLIRYYVLKSCVLDLVCVAEATRCRLITNSMHLPKVPVVGRPDFSSAWHPLQLGMFLTSPTHKFAG